MMEEEINSSPEAIDFDTQFGGGDGDVRSRTCTDRSRLDIPAKGEARVGFGEQRFLEITRVRGTSLVERMDEEIEKDFLDRVDFNRMRLHSRPANWFENHQESFELNDENFKARDGDDDDTSSTGTVDTTDKFQESSHELSDSWTSDSFSSAENDIETMSDLRIGRIRERFLPLLSSRTQKSDGIWIIQVYHEADHFRFDMHKQGKTAAMTLYDDEARHTVQGLIDSMTDPKDLTFEVILRCNKTESLWLSSKDVLPKLSEITACRKNGVKSLDKRLSSCVRC
jgi:hypothetical protein